MMDALSWRDHPPSPFPPSHRISAVMAATVARAINTRVPLKTAKKTVIVRFCRGPVMRAAEDHSERLASRH